MQSSSVVQDIFLTETAQLADVVLPGACFAERDGTQTSTERRVQKWRKAQDPPGKAKADWQIISELAGVMGFAKQFPYKNPEEIFTEISKVTPSYGGMDYVRLDKPEALSLALPDKRAPGYPHPPQGEVHSPGRSWYPDSHRVQVPRRSPGQGLPVDPLHGPLHLALAHGQHDPPLKEP